MRTRDATSSQARSVAWWVPLAIIPGLLAGPLLSVAVGHGVHMVPHDLETDYVLGVIWAVVLGILIFAWPVPVGDRVALLGLWTVKVFVALGVMLWYESSYSSLDAYGYFVRSIEPHFDWSVVAWGSGTENVAALAWLHGRVFPESYHALKVSFAMVGLLALYIFYRAATVAGSRLGRKLLVVLALTPSMLFWSSIVGKDPIILLGVAIYAYAIVRWARGASAAWVIVAIAGAGLAAFFRIWLAPILGFAAFVLALLGRRTFLQRAVAILVTGTALSIGVAVFRQAFFRETTLDLVEATNVYSQAWALGGSAQLVSTPFTSLGSIVKFLPVGMFTALLRPLPGEVKNVFGSLAGFENAAFLVLLLLAVWRTRLAELREPLVLWAATLVTLWSMIYGFVSYQNLGTGVRFRLQILPVFLLLLLYLARPRSRAAERRTTVMTTAGAYS